MSQVLGRNGLPVEVPVIFTPCPERCTHGGSCYLAAGHLPAITHFTHDCPEFHSSRFISGVYPSCDDPAHQSNCHHLITGVVHMQGRVRPEVESV
jgi:hypothetical protein